MVAEKFNTSLFLLFLSIVGGILVCLYLPFIPDDNTVYSYVFCSIYFIVIISTWSQIKKITPFFLFLLTFGLFIGGRFFAILCGIERDIWAPTFFFDYFVLHNQKIEILRYVISFLICSVLGYALSHKKQNNRFDISFNGIYNEYLQKILKMLFPIYLLIFICYTGAKLYNVIRNGYLSLYIDSQNAEYVGGSNLIIILYNVLFGISMAYGNGANRRKYLLLYIINASSMIIAGQRSGFGVALLILLWIYSQYNKVSLKRIALICFAAILLLLLIFSFSIRAIDDGFLIGNIKDLFSGFIYEQGISLMVFDSSRQINSYPIMCYLQTFLPGMAWITTHIFDATLFSQDISFGAHLAYTLNPELYAAGYGLGWSILSDIYFFSGRSTIIFMFLSLLFGFIIGHIEHFAERSNVCKTFIYSTISGLLLLPRSGLSGIIPYIFYIMVVILTLQISIKLVVKYKGASSS